MLLIIRASFVFVWCQDPGLEALTHISGEEVVVCHSGMYASRRCSEAK